jgi:hypothetical protein
MAFPFLVPIDLTRNEILNAQLQQLGTAPGTPVQGLYYQNSGDGAVFVYAGADWEEFAFKSYVNSLVTGGVRYKGSADASQADPDAATGNTGHLTGDKYRIATGGSAFGFHANAGDFVIFNGTTWDKIDSTDPEVTGTANRITVTPTGDVSYQIDIAATYVGQTSITTLGTITTGTWNGTTIAVANGGTGATNAADARTNLGVDKATLGYSTKYSALIGDGSATSFNITQATHGLAANGQMLVAVYYASSGAVVIADVSINNANGTVTISFSVAPTSNQFRVVIIG